MWQQEIVEWECDLEEGRTLSEFKARGVSCCRWNIVRKRKVGVFPKLDFGAGKVKTVCHRRRRPRPMGWINGNQPVFRIRDRDKQVCFLVNAATSVLVFE